jgi:hypothetical protein
VGRVLRIVIALAALAVPAALAAPAAALAAGFPGRVYVPSCTTFAFKPRTIDISCDGTNVLTGLKWSTWSSSRASGRGTDALNTCTPDCAHGKRTKHAATVTLSRPSRCKAIKHKVFKRIVVVANGEKAQTLKVRCPVVGGQPYY